MEGTLPYLLGATMLATVAVLVVGIVSFGVYGDFHNRWSNHLMRLRVVFQGMAVALLALIVYLAVM